MHTPTNDIKSDAAHSGREMTMDPILCEGFTTWRRARKRGSSGLFSGEVRRRGGVLEVSNELVERTSPAPCVAFLGGLVPQCRMREGELGPVPDRRELNLDP